MVLQLFEQNLNIKKCSDQEPLYHYHSYRQQSMADPIGGTCCPVDWNRVGYFVFVRINHLKLLSMNFIQHTVLENWEP